MVCAVLGLYTPSWCLHRCPEIGTSSTDWAQLSRFYLKTETESSLRNAVLCNINRAVLLDKDRTMDNVQKDNICMNRSNLAFRPQGIFMSFVSFSKEIQFF
jgi:hypothetical protein